MINLGEIAVKLTAKSAEFKKGMDDAVKSISKVSSRLKTIGGALASSAKSFAKWGAGIATAAGIAAAAIIKNSLNSIRELKAQAVAAGLTVSELQRGAHAARQFGIEQDKYSDILKDVNDRLGDMSETMGGPMKDFFENIAPKVGLTFEAFRKLSSEEALGAFVKAMQDANLSQQQMTFYMEALASDSTRLLPLFKNNASAMKAMKEEAKALGIGLSEIDVEKAMMAQRALDDLAAVIKTGINEVVVQLAPLLKDLIKDMLDWIKASGGIETVLVKGFEKLIDKIDGAINSVTNIGKKFLWFKRIGLGVTSVLTGILAAAEKLVQKFINLLRKLFSWASEKTGNFLNMISDDLGNFHLEVSRSLENTIDKTDGFFTRLYLSQYDGLNKLADYMNSTGSVLKNAFGGAMDYVKQKIEEANKKAEIAIQKQKDATKQEAQVQQAEAQGLGFNDLIEFSKNNDLIAASQIEHNEFMAEIYRNNEDAKIAMQASYQDQSLNSLLNYHSRIRQTEQETADFEKKTAAARREEAYNTFMSNLQIAAQGSKKMFNIAKGAAIADALLSAKASAVEAFEAGMSVGGPFAPIIAASYAAASLAKTAAMVNSIRSSSPSGGGGLSMGGFGGTGAQGRVGAIDEGFQGNSGPSRVFNVDLTGSSNISSQQARNLLEVINEQAGDGVEINVRGSANG